MASEHISDLEEQDLVEATRSPGEPTLVELTREGYQKAVTCQEPMGGEKDEISLHNFSVRFPIRFSDKLDDGWRERWCQGKVKRYTPDFSNDSYVYWKGDWRFRITGEHVIVRLEKEMRGEDPVNLKDRAMVEIFQARDWLQENSPVHIQSRPKDFRIWVNRQHLAIIEDPFCQLVDQYSDVDLQDVKIYDEDGEERLWLDNSKGEHHLEAGNAPGENREYAEDDVDFIKRELYEYLIDNKEAWRAVKEYSEDRDIIFSALAYLLKKEKEHQETGVASREAKVTSVLDFDSKWTDRWGNLMGYAPELGKPIKLMDSEELWG